MKKLFMLLALISASASTSLLFAAADEDTSKQMVQTAIDTIISTARDNNNQDFPSIKEDIRTEVRSMVRSGDVMQLKSDYQAMAKTSLEAYKASCGCNQ